MTTTTTASPEPEPAPALRLTLRNLKIVRARSEETTCFDVTLCFAGGRIGAAMNDGRGGRTEIKLEPGIWGNLRAQVDEAARAIVAEATDLDREMLAKHPRDALMIAVDVLVDLHEQARADAQAARRVQRKEVDNARAFARQGYGWMLRCHTVKQIVWYGLHDAGAPRVEQVRKACGQKYGAVLKHELMRTQDVLAGGRP